MTKARTIADLGTGFVNISDTGTEGTKVASGTTAQRGSTTGQFRFNSTTGLAEYYTGTQFKSIDSPPTISSISPTSVTTANANITITGTGFSSGATVKFIGNDGTEFASPSVTLNSSTQITATTPSTALTVAKEPYDVKVTNVSNLSSILADALDAGSTPSFSTASGSLGTLADFNRAGSNLTQIVATDADGQSVTISLKSGSSLPSGLTLNSNGTFSGTANAVGSDTTSSFTVEATDGTNTAERSYSITVQAPIASGYNSVDTSVSGFAIFAFTNTGSHSFTMNTSKTAQILLVAGGGAGGGVMGGGGGAGGLEYHSSVSLTAQTYSLTVGAGGSYHNNGSNSSGFGYSVTGGGKGGTGAGFNSGSTGGSGGGASGNSGGGGNQGGNASGTSGEGNFGGQGGSFAFLDGGGGGGGKGSGGGDCFNSQQGGGLGGAGYDASSIFGTNFGFSGKFASGGNGQQNNSTGATNYAGSGYNGSEDAQANTGSGGAGDGDGTGGAGGSGIILVRVAI